MTIPTLNLISIIQSVSEKKDMIRSKYKVTKAAVSSEPLNKNCTLTKLILHQLLIFYYNEMVYKLLYCTIWSLKYSVNSALSLTSKWKCSCMAKFLFSQKKPRGREKPKNIGHQ